MQNQVSKKICLTSKVLEEAIDNIRGAVMICYPMGLPEWDNVRIWLEGKEGAVDSVVWCKSLNLPFTTNCIHLELQTKE